MTDEIIGDTGPDSVINTSTDSVAGNLILGNQASGNGTYTITGDGAQTIVSFNPGGNSGAPVNVNGTNTNANGAVVIGNFGTGSFIQGAGQTDPNNQVSIAGDLVLGLQGVGNGAATDSAGTYTLNDGTLTVGGKLVVGASSTGTNGANSFTQNGGAVSLTGSASGNPDYTGVGNNNSIDSLLIGGGGGNIDYGTGIYTLNDGSVTASTIEVGHSGTGTFTQNGGTVTANYTLWVANATGSTGTYALAGGTLNASYGGEQVGLFGTGTFNQSGGINSDASALIVGSGFVGTYTMTGGVLNANNAGNGSVGLTVGDAGTGVFNQVSGAVTSGVADAVRADVVIGAQSGASGAYNLGDATNGAPTLQVYGDTTLGRDAGASGTLAIAGDGTTLSVNQYTGSVPQNGGNILIGLNGTGTVTQTDASTVYSDHNMVLGANAGSRGTYTLTATSLGGSSHNLFVGSDLNIGGMTSLTDIYGDNFQTTPDGGTGTFNLDSGDVGTAGAVNVGNNDGSGTLAITGGTLSAGTGMNVGVNDGGRGGTGGGTGSVTQTAGAVKLGSLLGLDLGITADPTDQTTGSYTITGTAIADSSVLNDLGNAVIGNSGTGTFTQGLSDGSDTGVTVNVAGDLALGTQGSGVGTYTLNSGLLTVGGQLAVGGTSQNDNEFIQNGGTLELTNTASGSSDYVPVGGVGFAPWGGALAIGGGIGNGDGSNSGGTGTYTLNNGVINTYNLLVGPTGTGTLNQNNGAVTTTFVTLGFDGIGSYNLVDGTLQAQSEDVGYAGTGTFNQSGGSNTMATDLRVGANLAGNSVPSGTSIYNLTGGTLTSGNTTIGGGEQGAFFDANASDSISGNLVVGDQSITSGTNPVNLGTGAYTITGDLAALDIAFVSGGNGAADPAGSNGYLNNDPSTPNPAPNGALIVGQFGTGTFTQGLADQSDPGNLVTVAGDLVLGNQSGSQGQYTLNTGTLTVGGKLEVGGFSVNSNLFTQNGGTVSVTNTAGGNTDYVGVGSNVWSGWLEVGGDISQLNGGSGAYLLNGGTLNASGIVVGASGVGTFTQTGGAATAYNVYLGGDGGGFSGIGTYSLAAGALNASSELDGYFGVGAFDQSGGTNTAGDLYIAYGPNFFAAPGLSGTTPRQGNYSLSGGLLLAGNVSVGEAGVGNFYQAGGLVTVGQWFGGQIYPDGSVAPDGPNGAGSGTVGTLVIGAQAGGTPTAINGYNGAGSVGIYNLGLTGQGNTATWGGYPSTPGTSPPTFNNVANAPYLQVYGNVVIGRDGAGTATIDGSPQAYQAASGTFNLAGDGSVLQINNVVGTSSNGTLVVGLNGIGAFNQQDNTTVYLDGSLAIGLNDGSSGNYTLNAGDGAGTVSVGGNLDIGGSPEVGTPTAQTTTNAGTGTFDQNAGAVSVAGNLNIATNQNASGTYNLAGGSLTVDNDGYVGNNGGTGTINQTGGAATFGSDGNPGALLLGTTPAAGPASVGTYDLTGDTATLTVDGNVDLGVAQNATGNVVIGTGLDTPTLTINATSASGFTDGNLTIGDAGTGSLTLNSGTVTAAGYLTVGASGQGTLTLNAGSLTVAATTYVGGGATGTAAVVQDGGSFETGYLDIGFYSPSGATYDLYAGSVTVDNDLVLGSGFAAGSSGDFTQHGGTVAVNSGLYGIYINNNSVYSLLSGSLATVAGLTVGDNSGTNAQVLQSGGTATIGNDLIVGNQAGIGGSYTLSGSGQLTVGSASTTGFADIGEAGTGTFTQDSTASSTTIYGSLDVGRIAGGTGTVNLDAGSLTVADGFAVVGDSGTGFFNQGGASTVTVGSSGLAIGRGESNAGGGAPITGTGTYTLSGTASLTVTGGIALGVLAGNSGTFTQTGGSVIADNEIIGDGGGGLWNQVAGTNTVSGTITIGLANAGTYALSAGQVTAGGIIVDAQGSITGFGTIGGSGVVTDDGSITASGGDLAIANNLTGSGLLSIGTGATLDLAGTVGALGLSFTGAGALDVGQALGMDASITGFAASDLVVFSNITFTGTDKIGSYAGGMLTIDNASDITIATLTIAPPPSGSFQLADSGGNLAVIDVVCFAEGTRILTDHGEVAVEALGAGDRVVTHNGATRPIVWIGQRWIDVASHPRPERVLPIRIRRGAFAEQVPHNDLLVSPDHAIHIDGQLIPARLLVNGATIYQDASVRGIRYFHVELDRHDVILAEGLPSESYLDTGNRAIFGNAGLALVLHPDFSIQERLQNWQNDACAPLTVDESHVRPVWQRLAERAGLTQDGLHHAEGTADPELRLLVNGRMLKPIMLEGGRHLFALPRFVGGQAGTWRARLVSRSARPSDSRPWLDDGRRLGVAVQGITVRGGDEYHRLPVDHPDLQEGWWAVERLGNSLWRWTDGSAAMTLPEDTEIVEVTVVGGMTYPVAEAPPEAGRLAA